MTSSPDNIDASSGHISRNMFAIIMVITIIQAIIYYAVCLIINRKKINLD
jgi:hypothetical protein